MLTPTIPDGKGTFRSVAGGPTNSTFYDGEWLFGKKWGYGRKIYFDGSTYEGGWVEDQRGKFVSVTVSSTA